MVNTNHEQRALLTNRFLVSSLQIKFKTCCIISTLFCRLLDVLMQNVEMYKVGVKKTPFNKICSWKHNLKSMKNLKVLFNKKKFELNLYLLGHCFAWSNSSFHKNFLKFIINYIRFLSLHQHGPAIIYFPVLSCYAIFNARVNSGHMIFILYIMSVYNPNKLCSLIKLQKVKAAFPEPLHMFEVIKFGTLYFKGQ